MHGDFALVIEHGRRPSHTIEGDRERVRFAALCGGEKRAGRQAAAANRPFGNGIDRDLGFATAEGQGARRKIEIGPPSIAGCPRISICAPGRIGRQRMQRGGGQGDSDTAAGGATGSRAGAR